MFCRNSCGRALGFWEEKHIKTNTSIGAISKDQELNSSYVKA